MKLLKLYDSEASGKWEHLPPSTHSGVRPAYSSLSTVNEYCDWLSLNKATFKVSIDPETQDLFVWSNIREALRKKRRSGIVRRSK